MVKKVNKRSEHQPKLHFVDGSAAQMEVVVVAKPELLAAAFG